MHRRTLLTIGLVVAGLALAACGLEGESSRAPGGSGAAAGGVDPEALQLTRAAALCPHQLASVRRQVLAQDARLPRRQGRVQRHDASGADPPRRDGLRARRVQVR